MYRFRIIIIDSIFDYFYIIRTSIVFDSVDISDKTITSGVNILHLAGENLSREHISLARTSSTAVDEVQSFTLTESVTEVTAEVQSIQSASSISIEKQVTTTVQNVIKNDLISSVNYYATGAYLDVDLDPTDTIVYVADTTKFKPYGYLIIGSEVVRYQRKLSDRFLQVDRGQDFTTPKFWPAGTFIRQLSGLAIAFAGVSAVESDSSLVTMSGGTAGAGTESILTSQILTTEIDVNIEPEILIIPPTSGIADGFPTDIVIEDPLLTREDGIVDLLDDYEIVRRDGTSVFVINNAGLNYIYVGNFIQGNASSGIGNWGQFIDDGVGVSAMSIEQVQNYFPTLTLGDITDRALSTFTSLGEYFNLGNHSIQNAVAVYRQTTDNFGTHGYLDFAPIQGDLTIEVYSNIDYFPETGYLFFRGPSGQYSICYYGSKDNTTKTFTDIEYLRGNAVTLPPDTTEVIPYSID